LVSGKRNALLIFSGKQLRTLNGQASPFVLKQAPPVFRLGKY